MKREEVSKDIRRHRRYFFLYSVLFVIVAVFFVIITIFLKEQRKASLFVNIAGRERMLLQKITKEVLLYHTYSLDKKTVVGSVQMFEESLDGLLSGGMIQGSISLSDKVHMDKLDNDVIRRDLENIKTFWGNYKTELLKVLDSKNDDSMRYIIENNDQLLKNLDDIVVRIQQYYEQRANRIRIVFFIMTGLVIVGFLTAIVLQANDLSEARAELAAFETYVPICSRCKKIRKEKSDPHDPGSWIPMEQYFKQKADTEFTHGLCPECIRKLYPDMKNKEVSS